LLPPRLARDDNRVAARLRHSLGRRGNQRLAQPIRRGRAAMKRPSEDRPPKPCYRYSGAEPPAALAHLRDQRVWCVWRHELKGGQWSKPPYSWHKGRKASITDPENWCTFDEAIAAMKRFDLDGIGLVLEAAGYSGADLDDCITD